MGRYGPPNLLKMDIEGAEVDALRGATKVLKNARPIWLIELHGSECERKVRKILVATGYQFQGLGGKGLSPAQSLPHHLIAHPR